MRYIMRSGILWKEGQRAAYVKGIGTGAEKQIFSEDGRMVLKVCIKKRNEDSGKSGNARFRKYSMIDADGIEFAYAEPEFADGEDPGVNGRPLCRVPKVNHARVFMFSDGKEYWLIMESSRRYVLKEDSGKAAMEIVHRGLAGGWDMEVWEPFSYEMVCGLFLFGRYMEKENEFLIV